MIIPERAAGDSVRDFAFKVLKQNIVSLELKPGTLISENEIASALGISRTPVREAIIDLNKANIIEILPQRGSYVALIDTKMVEEARFLRRVLDSAVIEAACENVEPKTLAMLEENLYLQEFYLEKGMPEKIFDLDNEFHKLIYVLAKKDIIYDMRSTLMIHFDRVRSLSMETVKDMSIVNDHKEMLAAIKAADKDKAVELVKKHLSRYTIDEHAIREQFKEYFK